MRFGIVDDCPEDGRELLELLCELRSQDEADLFTDGDSLLKALAQGKTYGCLFLDILMPERNGIELIPLIEKAISGPPPFYVFVTISRDYAVEAFAYHAAHYLVKPICQENVEEALQRVCIPAPPRPGILVKTSTTRRFVYLEEIQYLESEGHVTSLHLRTGEAIAARESLESLKGSLSEDFVLLTRGLIVNMDFIELMGKTSCILKDGRTVLLSRSRCPHIQKAYDAFAFRRLLSRGRD